METFVRLASTLDIAELARLEDEHRAGFGSHERGGSEWLRDHARLGIDGWAHRLGEQRSATVVAGVDVSVLGFATLCLLPGSAVAAVEAVYVTAGARSVGLGELLLGEALAAAKRLGATSIEAQALPGDRETKNLFERQGLVARLITVSRELS